MNTSRAKKRHRPLFFKNIFGSFGKAKKSKGAILSPPPSRMPQQSSPSRMPQQSPPSRMPQQSPPSRMPQQQPPTSRATTTTPPPTTADPSGLEAIQIKKKQSIDPNNQQAASIEKEQSIDDTFTFGSQARSQDITAESEA
jgi:hypothetical protein